MSASAVRSASRGPVLCLLAFTFLVPSGCKSKEAPTEDATPVAPVIIASRMSLANQLTVAGEFVPYEEVELHAKVAGYIRKMNVDIGDKVHAGEVLATLDVPELQAQVVGAGAGVAQAREQIARAKSEVARAVADHVALHSNAQRLADASKAQPGLIAEQELDNANAKDQAAEEAVNAAKSALAATEQALGVSQATQSQMTTMADYSRIVAPFDGVVTWRYADPGALIQAGTSNAASAPVVKIAQVSVLRLRIPVPESLANFVHDGDTVLITVGTMHKTINGTVARSTEALDPSTRTMQVEVDVPNKDGSLTPGMYAQVVLNISRAGDALAVPVTALDATSTQPWLYVVDSTNHVVKRNVVTGITTANRVEITSGLQAGEQVISTGLAQFTPGEHVQPKADAMQSENATMGAQ
jgi:RND family efflux transporter MFP subunit